MADDLETMFADAFAADDGGDNSDDVFDNTTNADINMGDDDVSDGNAFDDDSDIDDSEVDDSDESDDTDGATDDSAFDVATYKDQLVTVKVNGKDVQVPLGEALNGYMRQSDYTQKTQATAEAVKLAEWATQLQQAIQSDPEGTIQYLARAYGLDAPTVGSKNDPYENLDPEFAPLVQTVRQQQQMLAQMEAQMRSQAEQAANDRIMQAVQAELFATRKEFPDMDEVATLELAAERNLSIRDAHLLLQAEAMLQSKTEAAKAKAKADKVAAAEAAKRAKSGKTLKGSNAPGAPKSDFPDFDSFEDMLNWNLEHSR